MVEHEYITKETADEIKNIIQEDNFLRKAYNMNRLFVSTDNRMEGRRSFTRYVSDEKKRIEKLVMRKKEMRQRVS
ncbi:MAG TPA: hypothetical protein LFW21_02915 [Rickettsia endosymbiont of Pyrocoelia pectoralis]|nr:hypothetical protein [Rickettsia endosymbiont of Pyrocoelia pectoralis]